ncbi:sensor histidine kinase [Dactylosporangium darangshiense]|uniref:Oxygen sensor histidine kinase NreB n=1 Tax=Dactylosporangium darangshiense TaxID=579108 RepID=A0ABP8DT90_9ACTN
MWTGLWSRFGLRTRMAASYVLVSAAAVLLVEAVVLGLAVPRILASERQADQARRAAAAAVTQDQKSKASLAAVELAAMVGQGAAVIAARDPERADGDVLTMALKTVQGDKKWFGVEQLGQQARMRRAVADPDGRLVAGDPPMGQRLPAEALRDTIGTLVIDGVPGVWATAPIQITETTGGSRRIGLAYVAIANSDKIAQSKTGDTKALGDKPEVVDHPIADRTATADGTSLVPLITPAAVALVLLLPVGALFGLLSTGRLIRRIRRLAAGTTAMAGGDLAVRIPASGRDEVGRLEDAFNTMAGRLAEAQDAQRVAAGAKARQAERARIARELHDAISQDLFSASLLAGGLRKALPEGTQLRHQATAMEESLARTMREMRAMLLELRPIALEDAGLAEAIGELCRAYEARVGVRISAEVADLPDDPAVEHAVLRMAQEALANAVRHGDPSTVDVRVEPEPARDGGGPGVAVTVRDDGLGFDPASAGERHGMGLRLMRERAAELGGIVEVHSAPGEGTTVRVRLPIGV